MSGFDYGNARIRAMKSRLIPGQELIELAESESVQELISALSHTDYKKPIEAALAYSIGMECITLALLNAMVQTLNNIINFYHDEPHQMINIILQRYDIDNLKAILRGLSNNVPSPEIQRALLPVGETGREVLEYLTKAPGLREAIDTMASMNLTIAYPLIKLRTQYPGASTFDMEIELEKWYFDESIKHLESLRTDSSNLETALKLDADFINLLTIMRSVHELDGYENLQSAVGNITRLFVGPGFIAFEWLKKTAQVDQMEAIQVGLSGSKYEQAFIEGLEVYKNSGKLSDLEKRLKCYQVDWTRKLINKDPLGIGLVIGYLALKMQELRNLRWIAQGVNMNLKSESIQKQLEFCV